MNLIELFIANVRAAATGYEATLAECGADDLYTNDPSYYGGDHAHFHGCSTRGASKSGIALVAVMLVSLRRRRFSLRRHR